MLRRSILFGLPALLIAPSVDAALPPEPLRTPMSSRDADILARTIYGEAVGESERGQIAVAHVIFNRVRSASPLFKNDVSVTRACLREQQFSCWNKSAGRRRLSRLDLSVAPAADIRNLAWLSLYRWRHGEDVTNGATNFLRAGVRTAWEHRAVVTARIGKHVFFKLKE